MSEMCSVCIVRAQRDDDDFLPCSPACYRAALSDCEQRVLNAAREAVVAKALHSPKCWALLPAFDERDCNCACAYALAAIDGLKEKP